MTLSQILSTPIEKAIHSLFDVTIDKIEFQSTRKEFEGDITMVIFPLLKVIKSNPVELGNKIGASWQTITGTADLSTVVGDIADITANGGFNGLLILPSSNAAVIETLYVDDIKFSGVPDTSLSDVTSDLDAGKAWLYDNSPNNFNTESVLNIISGTV